VKEIKDVIQEDGSREGALDTIHSKGNNIVASAIRTTNTGGAVKNRQRRYTMKKADIRSKVST
jgi:hypothetical protein